MFQIEGGAVTQGTARKDALYDLLLKLMKMFFV
jgi:hypothetical protein